MLRSVTFERNVLLSLFVNAPEYKMPVLENAVFNTFEDVEESWNIRTSEAWEKRKDIIRENLYQSLMDELEKVRSCAELIDEIKHFCRRTRGGESSKAEIEEQLDFYFSDGFLSRRRLWGEIPRYLKALKIRADKMAGDIRKDREKSAEIYDEISVFYEKGAGVVCADEAIFQKYIAAEEKQIRIYAPTMAKRR